MTIETWRDIALILLAVEGFFLALIPGALFYFLWKGARITIQWLKKTGLPQARQYSHLAAETTNTYGQKISAPFAKIETGKAALISTLRSIAKTPKQRNLRR